MAEQITNKSLAFLLVGAIVVSLFGTFISLNRLNSLSPGLQGITGLATNGTGTVTLSVSSSASFRFAAPTVDFGTIQPNSTGFWISTASNNSWANGSGNANNCLSAVADACRGIEIENDGNEVLNISFNTTSNATHLIGGTAPAFSFMVANGTRVGPGNSDGCNGTITYDTWQTVVHDTMFPICNGTGNGGLGYSAGADRVTIEFNLTIPGDAPQATGQANITVWNLP